jgi:ATP-dependent HslUV protease ATP-binding subunit HslU
MPKQASAPIIVLTERRFQVEATKFTEVGFHGRDVDQIIRDLVDNAILLTKQRMRRKMQKQIDKAVEERILEGICGRGGDERTRVNPKP